jgi:hypothetical protein
LKPETSPIPNKLPLYGNQPPHVLAVNSEAGSFFKPDLMLRLPALRGSA